MSGQDDDLKGGQYASPPCFMHELDPEFRISEAGADPVLWADVARWRKAERARRHRLWPFRCR